jgi:hypothetical protein
MLGVRNLHFTLTASGWHQPFRGRPLGELKTHRRHPSSLVLRFRSMPSFYLFCLSGGQVLMINMLVPV